MQVMAWQAQLWDKYELSHQMRFWVTVIYPLFCTEYLAALLNYWQDANAVAFEVTSASYLLPQLMNASLTFCAKDAGALIVNIFYSVHVDSHSAATALPKHAF